MRASAKFSKGRLLMSNGVAEASFSLERGAALESLKDLSSGKSVLAEAARRFIYDRESLDLTAPKAGKLVSSKVEDAEDAYQGSGVRATAVFTFALEGGATLTLERQFTLYDGAPALRSVDFLSSDKPLAGVLYSDLAELSFLEAKGSFDVYDYFSCSDQSNWRLIKREKAEGKTSGFFAHDGSAFVYREGPTPDCQPVKTDYNFVVDSSSGRISALGLGFERVRPGERRRANGLVYGLLGDGATMLGFKRYQLSRYKLRPDVEGEFLANSWPAFELKVDEAKIDKELDLAAKAGLKTVVIDDGWFSTFMGEIDEKKFPNKFEALAKKAKAKGLNLGLWMNPLGLDWKDRRACAWDGAECHDSMTDVNEWNWLARTDDFIYAEAHVGGDRGYYGVDLMNPGCFQHIKNKILDLNKRYGIRRFKFDLYQLSAYETLLGDRHQHYERYRELLEELRAAIPDLAISLDVTRRNRPNFDFGLDFGRLFMENRGRALKDHRYYHPYMALRNLWQESLLVPSRRLELEVRPQEADYEVDYVLSTAIFANPLYWGALTELSEERVAAVAAFVKKLAPVKRDIVEGLVFPFGEVPQKGSWSGMASFDKEWPRRKKGFLAVYKNGAKSSSWKVSVPSLEGAKLRLKDVFSGETFQANGSSLEVEISSEFGFKLFAFEVKG